MDLRGSSWFDLLFKASLVYIKKHKDCPREQAGAACCSKASEAGTKIRMALVSLFETGVACGLNALQECLRALGAPAPHLA